MDALEKESILLYDICRSIGISSSQWKSNKKLVDCVTTLKNIHVTMASIGTHIICGSLSEGIRLFPLITSQLGTSSDIDVMCIFGGMNVQEHVDTTNTNQAEVLQLLCTDSPEHVLLDVISHERAHETSLCWIPSPVVKRKHGKYLASSSLFKDYIRGVLAEGSSFSQSMTVTSFKYSTIQGPAIQTEKCPVAGSADFVYCLRCYEWPTTAHEWIDRSRPHGWPSQDLIDQILYDGCELVPVGRKDHPDEDVQWKLSFTRAETRLIRDFNIYQVQCYQLLKIVKSCFISTVEADSLSSYHIKTVILHTVEQTDRNLWRKDNLAQCFMMCLSNLKRYLMDKFLPQYFIVRQNLLEPKVTGNVHQKVLEIVTDLDKIGWKCVLQCPVLQDLYQSIQGTVGSIPYTVITDIYSLYGNKERIVDFCTTLLVDLLTPIDPMSYNCYLIRIVSLCEKTFLKPTTIHPSVETVRVFQLLRKSEIGLLLTVIRAMAKPDHRPGIVPLMNLSRQCLEESCHADVSSCRLRFATFYFHLGEYDRCIATVQEVLERFKDVWVVGGEPYINIDTIENEVDAFKFKSKLNRVRQLSFNGFPFMSNHLSLPAFFLRWEVSVAPKGVHFLHKEMPRRTKLISEACCIDSIVYAHYLLLESYLKIDEYDLAEQALISMKESIRNRKDDKFDRNCLCFCKEDNLLLQYSVRLMTVDKSVKDK